jgi:hypothetical protein
MRWARDHGVRGLGLIGISIDPADPWLHEVLAEARRISGAGPGFSFTANVEIGCIDPDRFRALEGAGFEMLRFSVNSTSGRTLRLNRRKVRDLGRLKATLAAASAVAGVSVDVMLGLPGDDLESFKRSLDWVIEANAEVSTRPWEIQVNWVLAIPGSPLGDDPGAFGIRRIATPGLPYVLETDRFNLDDLVRGVDYVRERSRDVAIELKCARIEVAEPRLAALVTGASSAGATPRRPDPQRMIVELLGTCLETATRRWRLDDAAAMGDEIVLRYAAGPGEHMDVLVAPHDLARPAYARSRAYDLSYTTSSTVVDLELLEVARRRLDGMT